MGAGDAADGILSRGLARILRGLFGGGPSRPRWKSEAFRYVPGCRCEGAVCLLEKRSHPPQILRAVGQERLRDAWPRRMTSGGGDTCCHGVGMGSRKMGAL